MRRRTILGLVASTVTVTGCLSSDDSPSSVALSAADAGASDPDVTLSVAYNSTVQQTIPTEPTTHAEDGHKWLVVRVAVANDGEAEHTVTTHQYILEAAGETYEVVRATDSWSPRGTDLQPGETARGWLLFHPTDTATEATLRVRDRTQNDYDVTFTADNTLKTDLPD